MESRLIRYLLQFKNKKHPEVFLKITLSHQGPSLEAHKLEISYFVYY